MTAPVLHLVPPPPPEPAPGLAARLTADEQLNLLALVFADAIAYRTPGFCPECLHDADGLCPGHATDLDRTDDYLRLAADLGIDLEATEDGLGDQP
jgi:hypothetical protein